VAAQLIHCSAIIVRTFNSWQHDKRTIPMIELIYPGLEFDEQELIDAIKASGKVFMIQGQRVMTLGNHPKPNSLDVWLRKRFSKKQDMKLADNYVVDSLVKTGKFAVAEEICPDSGRLCKAIRLA
jgi:hypothetical protein